MGPQNGAKWQWRRKSKENTTKNDGLGVGAAKVANYSPPATTHPQSTIEVAGRATAPLVPRPANLAEFASSNLWPYTGLAFRGCIARPRSRCSPLLLLLELNPSSYRLI